MRHSRLKTCPLAPQVTNRILPCPERQRPGQGDHFRLRDKAALQRHTARVDQGDLFDSVTGEWIGLATQEQMMLTAGRRSNEIYLRPDGTPSAHSGAGNSRKVRVEVRTSPAVVARHEAMQAASAVHARRQQRQGRRVRVIGWVVAAWFAFAIGAAAVGSLNSDERDGVPSDREDPQQYPDLCWTQSGQEPC